MPAVVFVSLALAVAGTCALLWLLRRWRLAALAGFILALIATVAEGPRAATELWGNRTIGIVAATAESLRLELVQASGTRNTHYNPKHRFGATVCYRAPGSPGLGAGAPLDPAIQAAIGEAPTPADRFCHAVPGEGTLRQTEIRLDEATYEATRPGQPVTLSLLRPFGILEWAWPIDAPLLPWLARPSFHTGPHHAVPAEVLDITIDRRGRTLLNRRAHDLAVPIAHVRLRYAPNSHPGGVEGIDTVDAPAVAHLAAGQLVTVSYSENTPRAPRLPGVTRDYWWRNSIGEVLVAAALLVTLVAVAVILRRRRRAM